MANVTSTIVATVAMFALIIGVMVFITSGDAISKMISGGGKKSE